MPLRFAPYLINFSFSLPEKEGIKRQTLDSSETITNNWEEQVCARGAWGKTLSRFCELFTMHNKKDDGEKERKRVKEREREKTDRPNKNTVEDQINTVNKNRDRGT